MRRRNEAEALAQRESHFRMIEGTFIGLDD